MGDGTQGEGEEQRRTENIFGCSSVFSLFLYCWLCFVFVFLFSLRAFSYFFLLYCFCSVCIAGGPLGRWEDGNERREIVGRGKTVCMAPFLDGLLNLESPSYHLHLLSLFFSLFLRENKNNVINCELNLKIIILQRLIT